MNVGTLTDGRKQIFIHPGDDGAVLTRWQNTNELSSVLNDSWQDLGIPGGVSNPHPPVLLTYSVVAVNHLTDGRIQIFAIEASVGNIYTKWKLTRSPDSGWSEWQNLGNPGVAFEVGAAVGNLPDGRMQIFAIGVDGNIYTKWKLTRNPESESDWSGWINQGNPGIGVLFVYGIAVGYLPDGRMQIFAIAPDGNICTQWKLTTDPDSGWSEWQNLGNPATGIRFGSGNADAGYFFDGRTQIFAIEDGGNLYTRWKLTTDPDSGWSDWQKTSPPRSNVTNVSVGWNVRSVLGFPDIKMQIFAVTSNGIYTQWKNSFSSSSSDWSDWEVISFG